MTESQIEYKRRLTEEVTVLVGRWYPNADPLMQMTLFQPLIDCYSSIVCADNLNQGVFHPEALQRAFEAANSPLLEDPDNPSLGVSEETRDNVRELLQEVLRP